MFFLMVFWSVYLFKTITPNGTIKRAWRTMSSHDVFYPVKQCVFYKARNVFFLSFWSSVAGLTNHCARLIGSVYYKHCCSHCSISFAHFVIHFDTLDPFAGLGCTRLWLHRVVHVTQNLPVVSLKRTFNGTLGCVSCSDFSTVTAFSAVVCAFVISNPSIFILKYFFVMPAVIGLSFLFSLHLLFLRSDRLVSNVLIFLV